MAVIVFRRLLGEVLRSRRVQQGRSLRDLCAEASVSLGYMSEIERGHKEASSELLASICAALDAPLSEILSEVADAVALEEARLSMAIDAIAADPAQLPPAVEGGTTAGDVVASAA
jgi:transcriptional regulator with XRE-family HTH domain